MKINSHNNNNNNTQNSRQHFWSVNDSNLNGVKASSPTVNPGFTLSLRKISNSSTASSSAQEVPQKVMKRGGQLLSTNFQEKNQFTFEGRLFSPVVTYFENDLNLIFAEDEKKFLGVFKNDEYIVKRTYLSTVKDQNRLYYTRIDPYVSPKAHICIIHGFAEHSGRYIDVSFFVY